MKMIKIFPFMILSLLGCKDQLDIPNPNQPTPANSKNEPGIIALAQGALYINGFQETKFGGYFTGLIINFHELMGDAVGSKFGPGPLYCPDRIILDDGSVLLSIHPAGQKDYLRKVNIPSAQDNPFAYEWSFMYSLNGAMNNVLESVKEVDMSESKKNTIKAWAFFWKGFAYSRIGSMYYAGIVNDYPGIINNQPGKTDNKYITNSEILTEAESNFTMAEELLGVLIGNKDYETIMDALIPSDCKQGKGFPLGVEEWLRNINTMRARNILVNTPVNEITSTQWDQILTFTSNGVKKTDNTFTLRTDALGNLLPQSAYTAVQTTGDPSTKLGGNVVSERLIQDFKPGDKRFTNNFMKIPTWIGPGERGTSFNTRYLLVNNGKGIPDVVVMANRMVGADELYIAGSYEENILMQAEANIYKGNIDAGLALIDELRMYQGAGLETVSGVGLTLNEAKEELRRERRVGLAFRGFSFYDARRWGVLKNGRTGCMVVDFSGVVNTDATIQYGYLDYWDVPIAESFYNPPSPDSAPILNPD